VAGEIGKAMSRSRKKTPVCGMTKADSEKSDKVMAHKKERRAVRIAVANGDEPMPPKAFGNPWAAAKDGRQWHEARPEWMRK
jgi:hypothetical protein